MQPDTAIVHEVSCRKRLQAVPEAHKVGLKVGLSCSLKTEAIRTRWRAAALRQLRRQQTPDLFPCP